MQQEHSMRHSVRPKTKKMGQRILCEFDIGSLSIVCDADLVSIETIQIIAFQQHLTYSKTRPSAKMSLLTEYTSAFFIIITIDIISLFYRGLNSSAASRRFRSYDSIVCRKMFYPFPPSSWPVPRTKIRMFSGLNVSMNDILRMALFVT